MRFARAFAILFVIGAVLLTLLDSIHVRTHTLAYEHAFAFGSAWWVPLLMGFAAAIGGVAYVIGWERLGGPAKLAPWPSIARALLAFSIMYAASGLLPATAQTKLVVISIAALLIFQLVDGTAAGAILVVVGAPLGALAEITNVALHGFHYLDPDFLGVPVWLPALYACAIPALGQLARHLAPFKESRRCVRRARRS